MYVLSPGFSFTERIAFALFQTNYIHQVGIKYNMTVYAFLCRIPSLICQFLKADIFRLEMDEKSLPDAAPFFNAYVTEGVGMILAGQ